MQVISGFAYSDPREPNGLGQRDVGDDVPVDDVLVLPHPSADGRMVLHRPTDMYGDGYLHLVQVELVDSGLSARGVCDLQGQGAGDLTSFLVGLGDAWRGWTGAKSWTSLGEELAVEATHDGRALVTMAVTLRRPRQFWEAYRPPDESATWSARLLLTVEAGEELASIAQQAQTTLRPAAPN